MKLVSKVAIAFALTLSSNLFPTPAAFATETVELTTDHITINNQSGEDVVLLRSSTTPKKVQLQMNPRVEFVKTCAAEEYRQNCEFNSFQCGRDQVRVCRGYVCWWDTRPSYCCFMKPACSRWEDRPVTFYEDIELKFKDNVLESSDVDSIQLTPVARGKVAIKVLSSKKPYRIKSNSDQNKFELRQK